MISYQLIDVGRKRKVETYWRIEDEYKSIPQATARKQIESITKEFIAALDQLSLEGLKKTEFDMLVDYYNKNYHLSPDESKRDIAWNIRTRLRLLNQMGVLLKKRMISKELLFSLIGLGFEIDHPALLIILTAHRRSHNAPRLYDQFEYLWKTYLRWKNRN